MQKLSAYARVEIGLNVNAEKPFRAAEQRLASPTDATIDVDHPEENVEDYKLLATDDVRLHLFARFSHQAQLSQDHGQNFAR